MIDHKKLALTTNDPFGGNLQALLFVGEQIARVADALEKTPQTVDVNYAVNAATSAVNVANHAAAAVIDQQQAMTYKSGR